MSALQTYLRDGGSVADLLSTRAIVAKQHSLYPSLYLFKYNQITSAMGDPVVQSARGPILDAANGWAFVARPFDKFFNHGEGHAAPIDWSTARVQEKVDGSLMVLYHHDGAWRVASSGTPDAGGEVNGCGFTFADLFWRTWRAANYALPRHGVEDWTFMFELTAPGNRVVVRHAERRLTLLAARHRFTGIEWPVEHLDGFGWNVVRSFPLQRIEDVVQTFATLDPLKQEGYVIVDGSARRIKVKHPGYVAIHHMRDGVGPRRILEIVRSGETSELLAHFPEWRTDFDRIGAAFMALADEIAADFVRLRDIPAQKDFALQAVNTRCSGALFALRKGQVANPREYLAKMHVANLMDMLRLKDTAPTEEA